MDKIILDLIGNMIDRGFKIELEVLGANTMIVCRRDGSFTYFSRLRPVQPDLILTTAGGLVKVVDDWLFYPN